MSVVIIIQGPTTFYNEMIATYAQYKNVLWCTWNDEPINAIEAIKLSGIEVHMIDKPIHSGYWNINYQCKSTYEGILIAKSIFKAEYFIKIRSDFVIKNFEKLASQFELTNRDINFLGWAKFRGGFFLDYVVAGKYSEMEKFWEFVDSPETGLPFPERYLQNRYFDNTKDDICLSDELYNEYSKFFPQLDDIDIYWLKQRVNIKLFMSSIEFNYSKFKLINAIWLKTKEKLSKIRNIYKQKKN